MTLHVADLVRRGCQLLPDSVPVRVPHDVAEAHLERGGRTTRLRTIMRRSHRGELRSVCITGPKVDIVTTFLWPDPTLRAPTYAMELVAFAGRPVVAVVDVVPLAAGTEPLARRAMAAAFDGFPEVTPGDDPPPWYVACRTGHDLFLRPPTMDALAEAGERALAALEASTRCLREAAPLPADAARDHAEAQRKYKRHHRINTPGLQFLERGFGIPWTSRFLDDHVFA